MRKLKIVRIISRLNIGGPAIHTILLTHHLNDEQFESYLVTGKEDPSEGNMLSLADAKGVKPIQLGALGRKIAPLRDLKAGLQIWRILRRIKPDILHTHASKAGVLGRLAAMAAGVPIRIHTFHGHVLQEYFSGWVSRTFVRIERALARRTHVVIGVSREVCNQLMAMGIGDSKTVRHISIGLELAQFTDCDVHRGELRRELGIPGDVALIGIVARLVPIKGHKVFFEAARRLHDQRAGKVKFLVVGDGELRQPLAKEAQDLGLEDQVIFTGFRSDLKRIYADLDGVALSSYNEGTPVALIEALAAGRPGVATRVGGVPELIEDGVTGFLIDSGDAGAMADRLGWLLDHPEEARQMGARGRQRVIPSYCIEQLAKNLRQLYLELADKKGVLSIEESGESSQGIGGG